MQPQRRDSKYRAARDAILERDDHRCQTCGRPALTVRYHDSLRPRDVAGRLDITRMAAVCTGCQLLTPAYESGVYDTKLAREGIGVLSAVAHAELVEARRTERQKRRGPGRHNGGGRQRPEKRAA